MAIEIIDGVGSQNHVTSDQVGLSQEGTIGTGAIILPVGQQMGYDIVSNNQVNIKDGVYVIQGKRGWVKPGTVEQCTIQTGNNGQYRNDLICIKYTKNAQSKIEEFSVAVVKGTPGASGVDPTYTNGDINDGALESYAPIYRVRLNGINIIGVDLMATKINSLVELGENIGNIASLTTSAKASLVAAINELKSATDALNRNLQTQNFLVDIKPELTGWRTSLTKSGNTCCVQVGIEHFIITGNKTVCVGTLQNNHPKDRIYGILHYNGNPIGFSYIEPNGDIYFNFSETGNYSYMISNWAYQVV